MDEKSPDNLIPQPINNPHEPKLILFNPKLAFVTYSIALVFILFILFFSTQGSFLQVITAGIAIVGLLMLIAATLTSAIQYILAKRRGQIVDLKKAGIQKMLLIWSPFFVSLIIYAIYGFSYTNSHRPNQATVVSLIRDCKVSSIQDLGNGDVEISEINSDPSQGAIITHSNLNVLNDALKSVNHECTFVKRAYNSDAAITKWLTEDNALTMIRQCKITSIQGYTQENIQSVLGNVTLPASAPTGILLENWGHDQLLYLDQAPLAKVDPVAQQYKSVCNNARLINYGL